MFITQWLWTITYYHSPDRILLNLIHHLFLFTINSLEYQPTPSQFIQPVDMQSLALPTATIHCTLSEYATR